MEAHIIIIINRVVDLGRENDEIWNHPGALITE